MLTDRLFRKDLEQHVLIERLGNRAVTCFLPFVDLLGGEIRLEAFFDDLLGDEFDFGVTRVEFFTGWPALVNPLTPPFGFRLLVVRLVFANPVDAVGDVPPVALVPTGVGSNLAANYPAVTGTDKHRIRHARKRAGDVEAVDRCRSVLGWILAIETLAGLAIPFERFEHRFGLAERAQVLGIILCGRNNAVGFDR